MPSHVHNPERRLWRGRSYKRRDERVRDMRGKMQNDKDYDHSVSDPEIVPYGLLDLSSFDTGYIEVEKNDDAWSDKASGWHFIETLHSLLDVELPVVEFVTKIVQSTRPLMEVELNSNELVLCSIARLELKQDNNLSITVLVRRR